MHLVLEEKEMKRYPILAALALLASGVWSAPAEAPQPKVGEAAPPFALLGSDSRAHGLMAHRGKQPVVLAFYPKAFTGG